LITSPSTSLGLDSNECFNENWKSVEYYDLDKGQVTLYKTPIGYKITATNATCILIKDFVSKANRVPMNSVIGLISEDYRQALIVKWNLEEDYLLLIEASIDQLEYRTIGKFVMYPSPLERIKEVVLNKKFPNPEDLKAPLRRKFKTNYLEISVFQLRGLLENASQNRQ
jgi:hypothetical protein